VHAVKLGDAVDDVRDRLTELINELLERYGGVLDSVVEQRGRDRYVIQPEFGNDLGDRERVRDVALTRFSPLVSVGGRGDSVGPLNAIDRGPRSSTPVRVDDSRKFTFDADGLSSPWKNSCHGRHRFSSPRWGR